MYNQEYYVDSVQTEESVTKVLPRTFLLVFLALLVSALTGFLLVDKFTGEDLLEIAFGAIIVQCVISVMFGVAINKLPIPVLGVMFFLYAGLFGVTFSLVLLVIEIDIIYQAFLITSGIFLTMAIYGATLKKDLSKFGSLLMMALFGVIIAIVVNWFIGSEAVAYFINIITVIIFTGLVAYDTQKIKKFAGEGIYSVNRIALLGAFILFLDFINIFLRLVQILARNKK